MKIKELRKQAKFSQGVLAEKSGMSTAAISSYELNNRSPDAKAIIKIAKALNVPIGVLFGESEHAHLGTDARQEIEKLTTIRDALMKQLDANASTIKVLCAARQSDMSEQLGNEVQGQNSIILTLAKAASENVQQANEGGGRSLEKYKDIEETLKGYVDLLQKARNTQAEKMRKGNTDRFSYLYKLKDYFFELCEKHDKIRGKIISFSLSF